mmetsp:Transcript_60135/g.172697  ORF Transcript_60135/g.172697 Transcript_60135/m.172697 type:complete len:236 (+) Transcript_60135:851-1558(+)
MERSKVPHQSWTSDCSASPAMDTTSVIQMATQYMRATKRRMVQTRCFREATIEESIMRRSSTSLIIRTRRVMRTRRSVRNTLMNFTSTSKDTYSNSTTSKVPAMVRSNTFQSQPDMEKKRLRCTHTRSTISTVNTAANNLSKISRHQGSGWCGCRVRKSVSMPTRTELSTMRKATPNSHFGLDTKFKARDLKGGQLQRLGPKERLCEGAQTACSAGFPKPSRLLARSKPTLCDRC